MLGKKKSDANRGVKEGQEEERWRMKVGRKSMRIKRSEGSSEGLCLESREV